MVLPLEHTTANVMHTCATGPTNLFTGALGNPWQSVRPRATALRALRALALGLVSLLLPDGVHDTRAGLHADQCGL